MSSQLTVKYNATPPTVGDGQTTELQVDSSGNLKTISGATGSSANQVQGNVASGATDSGKPVKVGGKVNSVLPTYTDGQRSDLQTDVSGNLRVYVTGGTTAAVDGVANTNVAYFGSTTSISTGTVRPLCVGPYVYNGSTWDRVKKPSSISRIVSSANTTNATSAKASAGDVFFISAYNSNAAVRYLKLYNKASAPTVGTDTPVMTIALVPSTGFVLDLPSPLHFSTGIAYALTTGSADADSTAVGAADILGLNIGYA